MVSNQKTIFNFYVFYYLSLFLQKLILYALARSTGKISGLFPNFVDFCCNRVIHFPLKRYMCGGGCCFNLNIMLVINAQIILLFLLLCWQCLGKTKDTHPVKAQCSKHAYLCYTMQQLRSNLQWWQTLRHLTQNPNDSQECSAPKDWAVYGRTGFIFQYQKYTRFEGYLGTNDKNVIHTFPESLDFRVAQQ